MTPSSSTVPAPRDASAARDAGNRVVETHAGVIDAGRVELTVVCPFFNEQAILCDAVTTLLAKLAELPVTSELIVVNDGSVDGSRDVVLPLCEANPRLRLVSYPHNRGRGYALRQGIARARGDVVITTEIDLSWGEDVIERLWREMNEHPDTDIVVASPHLPGGGYRNVPAKRVFLSQMGNKVIRACMSNACTMNTGMTRAYRREVIQSLPLEEDRKEFHLEVILKARALNHRIREIPCVLEWKDYKHQGRTMKRKSSSNVNRLVVSHSLFSVFANPVRYVWTAAGLTLLLSIGFLIWAVVRLILGEVAAYAAIVGLSLAIFSVLFFFFGVIAQQGNMIQRELWTIKRSLLRVERERDDTSGDHTRSE